MGRAAILQRFTRLDALFTNQDAFLVFLFYVGQKRKTSSVQEETVKSKIAVVALITTLALAVIAAIAFAQEGGGGGGAMHPGMHRHFMGAGEGEFGMFLHQLSLSDDQKAQVKQIFQNEKPTMKPLMQQRMQAQLEMMQLVTSGNFDTAKATVIANREAQTHVAMEVEHAKMGAQIYQLLNSDQKAKVSDMMAKHQQRMEQHLQNQGAPASSSDR
jgi:protein CpxP